VSDSGSASVQEAAGATHTYTISCMSDYGNVQAQVTVNFTAAPGSGGSMSSGSASTPSSHGGGDLDPATLAILAMLAAMQLRFAWGQRVRNRQRL
jgi:hypothetical protein